METSMFCYTSAYEKWNDFHSSEDPCSYTFPPDTYHINNSQSTRKTEDYSCMLVTLELWMKRYFCSKHLFTCTYSFLNTLTFEFIFVLCIKKHSFAFLVDYSLPHSPTYINGIETWFFNVYIPLWFLRALNFFNTIVLHLKEIFRKYSSVQ